jgi:hypothetical protein
MSDRHVSGAISAEPPAGRFAGKGTGNMIFDRSLAIPDDHDGKLLVGGVSGVACMGLQGIGIAMQCATGCFSAS